MNQEKLSVFCLLSYYNLFVEYQYQPSYDLIPSNIPSIGDFFNKKLLRMIINKTDTNVSIHPSLKYPEFIFSIRCAPQQDLSEFIWRSQELIIWCWNSHNQFFLRFDTYHHEEWTIKYSWIEKKIETNLFIAPVCIFQYRGEKSRRCASDLWSTRCSPRRNPQQTYLMKNRGYEAKRKFNCWPGISKPT